MGDKKTAACFFYKLLKIIFENRKTEKLLLDVLGILASVAVLHGVAVFPLCRGKQTDTKSNKLRRTGITENRRYRESIRQ